MEQPGKWYVVQTLSGQEMKARESITRRLAQEEMEELVFEALVPMEKVTEVKQGRKATVNRKLFPGYLLVNVLLYDEERRVSEKVWTYVNETPGVIGFIGERPSALSDDDVQGILDQMGRGEEAAKPRIAFEVSETVKIRDGAFANFEGSIESIDPDRGRLKLSVSIFGRFTPVEVEYWQVEKNE